MATGGHRRSRSPRERPGCAWRSGVYAEPNFLSTELWSCKSAEDLKCARLTQRWKSFCTERRDGAVGALRLKSYCAVRTNGDGACALHSVFGRPWESSDGELFACDARAKLVATMGASVGQFRERLACDRLYDAVLSALWTDVLHPILLRECQVDCYPETSSAGEILWSTMQENRELCTKLLAFVDAQQRKETLTLSYNRKAERCFSLICTEHTMVFCNCWGIFWNGTLTEARRAHCTVATSYAAHKSRCPLTSNLVRSSTRCWMLETVSMLFGEDFLNVMEQTW